LDATSLEALISAEYKSVVGVRTRPAPRPLGAREEHDAERGRGTRVDQR
jgi:hypothetical protein